MAVELLTGDEVWRTLSKLARRSRRADVAVAWCASRVETLLPLKRGSVLVTDLTEGAVRGGQTRPRELLPLVRRGVAVHSLRNLHAKVFVFDDAAVIGSSNVSGHSADRLVEAAVLITRDRVRIAQARRFVTELAGDRVGDDELQRLEKLWRPPRVPGGRRGPREAPAPRTRIHRDPLWVFKLGETEWEEPFARADRGARPLAKKRMHDRRNHLSIFWCGLNRQTRQLRPGQQVLQVVDAEGRPTMVEPPGRVTLLKHVRLRTNRSSLLVYVEEPRGVKRRALSRYLRQVGAAGPTLRHMVRGRESGVLRDSAKVQALLQAWPAT